jgi:rhodanese-related sulfurtransferase
MSNINSGRLIKWTLLSSLFIWIILGSGCDSDDPIGSPEQMITDVTVKEAFDLIQDSKDDLSFVVLDIRTSEEFSEGHIENAINLDYYSETFEAELDQLDKGKTYLMHCKSGGRSSKAIDMMEELDFLEVYHLTDGMDGWKDEGFPVVSLL